MNTELLQQVAEHYQRKEFDRCILLADQGSLQDGADLALRYCSAMAYLCKGDVGSASDQLYKILEAYQGFRRRGMALNMNTLRFVGNSALQSALIGEYYWFEKKDEFLLKKALFSRTVATQIGKEINDAQLYDTGSVVKAYKQWERRNAEGKRTQGIWYVPVSPYVLQVELTNQCNLACKMCPRSMLTRKQGMMDMAVWDRILATWRYRERVLELPHLIFHGAGIQKISAGRMKLYFMGESLLHPGFDECIRTAREQGIQVIVQTNGVLLSDASLRQRILKAQPAAIGFSIDGISKQSYEYVRQGSSWDRLLSAIQALHAERGQMGLRNDIQLITAMIIPGYKERIETVPPDLQAFIEPLKPYMDEIGIKGLSRQSDGGFVDKQGNPVSYSMSPDDPPPMDQPLCPEILEKMNILWDGTAVPCCFDIDGSIVLGNAMEGVDAAWNSEQAVSLRDGLLRGELSQPLCRQCRGS